MNTPDFNRELAGYCNKLNHEYDLIPQDRVSSLKGMGEYIIQEPEHDQPAQLLFICTHIEAPRRKQRGMRSQDSRRSQFGQIWALAAAKFYGLSNIRIFSGGTGATAFNPRAVSSLERAGFKSTCDKTDQ